MADFALRTLRVPLALREFTVSRERAIREFGVPEIALSLAIDLGLPNSGAHCPEFDRRDLRNLLLALRAPSPQFDVISAVAEALRKSEGAAAQLKRHVDLFLRCTKDHNGECDFQVLPDAPRERTVIERLNSRRFAAEAVLESGPRERLALTPEQRHSFDEIAHAQFFHLPFALTNDLGFFAESGLADCRLALKVLLTAARRNGAGIRPLAGLLVAPPAALTHSWIEVEAEGGWRVADPFYIRSLVGWGLLRSDEWPDDRIPKGVHWSLGGAHTPLALDHSTPQDAILIAR
ncbi:hypothetical protein [Microbacterium enclense]|uniref:hypothetical protein n=1 Tax=Microbacterium enclense TaxID=993073 RepID=UPI003F8012D1